MQTGRQALKLPTDASAIVARWQQQFENELSRQLETSAPEPDRLHQAMRYSSLSGGKRIRPMLVYASGHALGLKAEKLKAIACSVELIHAYSLIHDDLPAMDDDELRRGRATCHIQFDEATAILAGDALQALAFQTLADELAGQPEVAIRLVSELARACGSSGMAGGQMLDLLASGKSPNINQLEHIHELKTGALIRTCVVAPGIVAGSNDTVLRTLDHFGYCVGLGFQIQDDILDVTGDPENLGKSINADAEHNKPTFPALIGLAASRARARELRDVALVALETLDGDVSILAWLADYMISRDR
jgi:farnesyl diphosphate synthase